jgi:hypothetical protein
MYLVATRIRRLCWARKPVVTSSRSAMVRTSIQACGTATTTLALPKPSCRSAARACRHRDAFAHQVFAGDAEMHRAARQLRGDLARREIGDLDIVEPGDGAAIVARAARLDQRKAGAREERLRRFPAGGPSTARRERTARSWRAPACRLRQGCGPPASALRSRSRTRPRGSACGEPSWVISPS